jgi:hypothetical protein
LEAFGGYLEDKLVGGGGIFLGKEATIVGGGESGEVVAEDLDELWWVSCRMPTGQGLGIDCGKFVMGFGVAVRDTTGGIPDGSE